MEKNNDKKTLELIIKSPLGDWKDASFDKTTKIAEVIAAVLKKFPALDPNGKYELRPEEDPNLLLDPNHPLVSYKLKDGDVLVFTDLGGAV